MALRAGVPSQVRISDEADETQHLMGASQKVFRLRGGAASVFDRQPRLQWAGCLLITSLVAVAVSLALLGQGIYSLASQLGPAGWSIALVVSSGLALFSAASGVASALLLRKNPQALTSVGSSADDDDDDIYVTGSSWSSVMYEDAEQRKTRRIMLLFYLQCYCGVTTGAVIGVIGVLVLTMRSAYLSLMASNWKGHMERHYPNMSLSQAQEFVSEWSIAIALLSLTLLFVTGMSSACSTKLLGRLRASRHSLHLVDLLLAVLGVTAIAVGIDAVVNHEYHESLQIGEITIGTGVFLVLLSAQGWIAAYKRSSAQLLVHAFLLLVLLLIAITVTAAAFSMGSDAIEKQLALNWSRIKPHLPPSVTLQVASEFVQRHLYFIGATHLLASVLLGTGFVAAIVYRSASLSSSIRHKKHFMW